jgi:hypothetical protein
VRGLALPTLKNSLHFPLDTAPVTVYLPPTTWRWHLDKKALFGEVDFAVEEALNNRISKLDTLELDEWTEDVLKEDARDVNDTVELVCWEHGWTYAEYNAIILRLRDNRHTPNRAKESR